MMLDSHLHLQDLKESKYINTILEEALSNNVRTLFCNSTGPLNWERNKQFFSKLKQAVLFFGVHPFFINTLNDKWEKNLLDYLEACPSGIGEIGIDKMRQKKYDFMRQKKVFIRQVEIAKQLRVPVIIHCVRAWGTLLEILKCSGLEKSSFMIHSFSGPKQIAAKLLDMGAFLSISPRNIESSKDIIEYIPINNILIETDFPHLIIDLDKGNKLSAKNYLLNLKYVYNRAAKIKGIELEEFENIVEANGKVFTDRIINRKREIKNT